MPDALEVVLEEAQGYDVQIYLEGRAWIENLKKVKQRKPALKFNQRVLNY
jgi:hypothetical protein